MTTKTRTQKITATKLRKLALAQQGLLKGNTFGKGLAGVENAIRHIGYVQIDTISVVERAHHHTIWSRVDNYKADHLTKLLDQKKLFEYWFHAAAILPIGDFRFALPRMDAIKAGEKHWFKNVSKKLMREVLKRIETEGPLLARDFEDPKNTNTGWWDWKPAKQALEQLFMQGELMVVSREGFQKRYDLTDRVLPKNIDTRTPSVEEEARYLVDTTIRAHGIANLKSFTYLRKGKALRASVKDYVGAQVESGALQLVESPIGDEFYAGAELLETSYRARSLVKLLSPFDNLVIQRERCRQIFEFDYQIECYMPKPKRQHGYFCLPILYKDDLCGRADFKADRKNKTLRLLYLQSDRNDRSYLKCLAHQIDAFREFNQCDSVVVDESVSNRELAIQLGEI